jgi:hypothetical protein
MLDSSLAGATLALATLVKYQQYAPSSDSFIIIPYFPACTAGSDSFIIVPYFPACTTAGTANVYATTDNSGISYLLISGVMAYGTARTTLVVFRMAFLLRQLQYYNGVCGMVVHQRSQLWRRS